MKILVIGGSGFIGTRLIELLVSQSHEVTNLDLRASSRFNELTTLGDVRHFDDVARAAEGCDAIVNLAAEHRDDVRPLSLYEEVNVDGAKVVVRAAAQTNVARILFTSSVAVYGLNKVNPDEDSNTEPFNEYSRTKLAAEKIYQSWVKDDSTRALVIIRPSVVFGEGNRGNVDALIRAVAARRFIMTGRGANKKSMSYVGNVAAFLASRLDEMKGSQTFNYADSPDLSSREIVETIADALHTKLIVPFDLPLWLSLLAGYVFDIVARVSGRSMPISAIRVRKFCAETSVGTSKLEASGFQPPFELRQALHRTIENDFHSV
jgi:nucleoside-diphosphate-sugar epimerase